MPAWRELRKELNITSDDERVIALEKELIRSLVAIREDQGLSQAQLAKQCNVKQPVIARIEKAAHSPQLNSLLKILAPMGYTLQIVPISSPEDK